VGVCVFVRNFEVKYLEKKELGDKLLWGAYRKVVGGFRMV